MSSQFTARSSEFNSARTTLDVTFDFVAAPLVPFMNEANTSHFADLMNGEPTPGQSSDVDALGEDAEDVQFPRLYLPTGEEAISEPQGTLAMLDVGASSDVSGFSFAPANFDFPSFPTDWDLTRFNHSSIVDEYPTFQATQPVTNDRTVLDLQIFLESVQPPHPGMDLKDFGSSPELLMNTPDLFPPHIESCSSSITTTPEPITPPNFASPPFLSPVQEQSSSSTLWDPQPCLAVPTSFKEITTVQVPVSLIKEKGNSPVLPGSDRITAESATPNHSSSSARSSSPTLPSDFFIQKPSEAGAQRSSHKKTESAVPRATKARRSAEKNKHLPCTHEGCMETFYDGRVLRRHLRTVHEKGSRWCCPGSCGKAYTRDDALNRHLNAMGEDSSCQVAARALGWHPAQKCSVQKLRVASV